MKNAIINVIILGTNCGFIGSAVSDSTLFPERNYSDLFFINNNPGTFFKIQGFPAYSIRKTTLPEGILPLPTYVFWLILIISDWNKTTCDIFLHNRQRSTLAKKQILGTVSTRSVTKEANIGTQHERQNKKACKRRPHQKNDLIFNYNLGIRL